MASTSPARFDPRRSRWIPWAFVGAFVVVIAVNVLLAVEASRSWTGVVTETPFDTGNDYNRILDETAHEAALGWKVAAQTAPIEDGKVRITVAIDGADVRDLDGTLLRPVGMHAPVPLNFAPVAPGRFQVDIKLPEAGNWDLHLIVRGAAGQLHTTRRLFVS
jgi:nitrogen fixation protein FixH